KEDVANTLINDNPYFSSPLIINREAKQLSTKHSEDIFEVHEYLLKPAEPEYIDKLKPEYFPQLELQQENIKLDEIQATNYNDRTEIEYKTKLQPEYSKTTVKISEFRIIGQFANTYIIAESKDEMVLIDQHAAHERVVYERLKKRSEGFKSPSQDLIVPEIVEFNYREAALLERLIPQLASVGIAIEPFGGRSFVVKSVPSIIDGKSINTILKDIVDLGEDSICSENNKSINNNILHNGISLWLDNILILMACHSAIRANHQLNSMEMSQLLADLERCDNPYHCPHGRPTIISFSKKELEKRFKRIG
ncbi:MAG: hypothetical protein HQK73_01475, partial [Desulfamplus sp.]|nr:hypothetical protein [Desulfamplus sp.]